MSGDLRVPMDPILEAFGVPATVTRPAPDEAPIETVGAWVSLTPADLPGALQIRRREQQRVFALSRLVVPTAPRGTRIVAPEMADGVAKAWQVDGIDMVEDDCLRLIVIPVGDEAT